MSDSMVSKLTRRNALGLSAGLVGGLALGGLATAGRATERDGQSISAAAIPVGRNFPPELWNQESWTLDVKPPFDLDDVCGRWYALMKSTQSLVGARTYVANYSRVFLCEVGKEPQLFFATCGSWTFQLVRPNPGQFPQFGELPEHTALQLGLYTGVILDPHTFKPVDEVYNPLLGRTVKTEDSIFAESYLLYPGGGMTSIERSQFMDSREPRKHAMLRSGNSLSWALPALFEGEGDFQPRMDSSWWRCKYDELMDPDNHFVDCDYSWVGLTRVAEKPWYGMTDTGGRVVQTLWNTFGNVTNKLERVEPIVQEHVFSKYPDRV